LAVGVGYIEGSPRHISLTTTSLVGATITVGKTVGILIKKIQNFFLKKYFKQIRKKSFFSMPTAKSSA
jgi:hypothetical protein